jgi:hypothetical protein
MWLFVGALIRAAALALPGTYDVVVWKIWSYAAVHQGVGSMYGVGGEPLERRIVSFHGAETTVDYPPLALEELALIGRAFRSAHGGKYPDGPGLVAAIKLGVVLSEVGLLLVMFRAVRFQAGARAARWAVLAYWLNPAAILDGAVLGYLDPLFVLPAVGSLVAATFSAPLVAGSLAAAAFLTKPQALVLAPALALALFASEPRHRLVQTAGRGLAGASMAAAVIVSPVLAAGGWANMLQALGRLGQHDMLSANACNVWWIVGYLVRIQYSAADMGLWRAVTAPAKILQISRFMEVGYPNARVIGSLVAASAMTWGVWVVARGRKDGRDLWLLAGLGAFLVHAYATLAAQVHENHLFAAVPLLALASSQRRGYVPVFTALTAILALNLNLFYGVSDDVGYAIPRLIAPIDLTVIVAAANCVALAWHATVLRREAGRPVVFISGDTTGGPLSIANDPVR